MCDIGTGSLFDLQALRSRGKTMKSRGQNVITCSNKNNNIVCVYTGVHLNQEGNKKIIAIGKGCNYKGLEVLRLK